MENIENIEEESEIKEEPIIQAVIKRRGQTRERMMELHKIRSDKALKKRQELQEIKTKEDEINNIKREKINYEYEEAQKIKNAIDAKKQKKPEEVIKYEKEKEVKDIYKSVSRDILKEKYIEEARKRVMRDLFS